MVYNLRYNCHGYFILFRCILQYYPLYGRINFMDSVIVLCTIDNKENARKIAQALLNEKVSSCINIIPSVESIYIWDNKITTDNEFLMIIKTRLPLFNGVKDVILKLHPYEVPEILCIDIQDGYEKYIKWIENSLEV